MNVNVLCVNSKSIAHDRTHDIEQAVQIKPDQYICHCPLAWTLDNLQGATKFADEHLSMLLCKC